MPRMIGDIVQSSCKEGFMIIYRLKPFEDDKVVLEVDLSSIEKDEVEGVETNIARDLEEEWPNMTVRFV